jgi:ribosomal protein L35AE/L33A
MNRKTAFLATAWTILPVALLVAAASISPVTAETNGAAGSANNDAKSLFTEKCSACHNLPNPTELSYTRGEWQRVVHTMLVKYKASDEISPTEASEIVDYLATFAPRERDTAGGGRGQVGKLWAAEPDDVSADIPSKTVIDNFEEPSPLSRLTREAAGIGGKPAWRVVSTGAQLDGNVVRVSNDGATPDNFALLADPRAKGADVDVKVRFKIVSGSTSPAIGIAVGVQDSRHYSVVRYNQKSADLSLIQIAEPTHTTVQQTAIDVVPVDVKTAAFEWRPGQWHTMRVQVKGGHVRAWIDSYKRINADLPGYNGGAVALWSQGDTVAVFDDWSTDIFDSRSE